MLCISIFTVQWESYVVTWCIGLKNTALLYRLAWPFGKVSSCRATSYARFSSISLAQWVNSTFLIFGTVFSFTSFRTLHAWPVIWSIKEHMMVQVLCESFLNFVGQLFLLWECIVKDFQNAFKHFAELLCFTFFKWHDANQYGYKRHWFCLYD